MQLYLLYMELGFINKLELVFLKHYAPNSLHLTVNSHHKIRLILLEI